MSDKPSSIAPPASPASPEARPSAPSLVPPDRETLPGRARRTMRAELEAPPPPARATTAIALGFATARARLQRRPTALTALLGLALVVMGAFIERRAGSAGAVDRALYGTFGLVIPLASFALLSAATGATRLTEAAAPIARYGVARHLVVLGTLLATTLFAALFAALFAMGSVAIAHTPAAPPLAKDLFQSAWIAGLTASAYTGWFALFSTFGERGRGKWILLVTDFFIGGSIGLFGAILPRANAQNLLGGAAPMHLSQAQSSLVLAASALVLTLAAMIRCRE